MLTFDKDTSLTIWKYIRDTIVPIYKKLETKLNLEKNSSISLPFVAVTPLPTTNIPVAPSPPNKNIDSTIKKTPKPLNTKKSYI